MARLQRSCGEARVTFKKSGDRTALDQLHQSGCCKLRFPRPEPGQPPEAVLINTAGGLTDGDELSTLAHWRADTTAVITTQAAERIYRSRGQAALVRNGLLVEGGATALWLPQETIMFDGGRMTRRLEAKLDETATLLACESIVFGRSAMGETVASGGVLDTWRIRMGRKLVYADGLRLEGEIRTGLAKPALGNGAQAVASLICVRRNAQDLQEAVRNAISGMNCTAGCSALGPVLVTRLLARTGAELRRDLAALIEVMLELLGRDEDGAVKRLPRVWSF